MIEFSEGVGMYTKGIKNLEEAVVAMREYATHEKSLDPEAWGEYQAYDPNTVTTETVKKTWYYQCRKCNAGDTVGDDNLCYECGEPIGTGSGRQTFMFLV